MGRYTASRKAETGEELFVKVHDSRIQCHREWLTNTSYVVSKCVRVCDKQGEIRK